MFGTGAFKAFEASRVLTWIALLLGITASLAAVQHAAGAETAEVKRYNVMLRGSVAGDGFDAAGTTGNISAARDLVSAAGGTVKQDLSGKIGVLTVTSADPEFAETMAASPLVADVAGDYRWKGIPGGAEMKDAEVSASADVPGGGPEQTEDPLESQQWSMQQIRAPEAHGVQAGSRQVEVGILDSGIDGRHADFAVDEQGSNVDCAKGRDFVSAGPGIGTPDPCTDNQFHGTHVAGIVGAQANGLGVVGVAPNVTLVPVKVCDAEGYCYASSTAAGITYAGDAQLEVINMSFFVDDNEFQESTEFKCNSDPEQRMLRKMNERAIQYARNQGVVPVAALGNSDQDLAHPVDDNGEPIPNECEVVPAETQGVIGTMSLGRQSEKARYSNYGTGLADIGAPGGNGSTGDCTTTVLSTFPANSYGCIQGTSMASPHAAGLAALIVSEFGSVRDGDVVMSPTRVESHMQNTAIDIGKKGYDECFGNGRVDALRAVQSDTSRSYDASAPACPEYNE